MHFDTENPIIQLCIKGMEYEMQAKPEEAKNCFSEAWNKAVTDTEKFTAAHYLARHQNSVTEKLNWDLTALQHAQQINDNSIKDTYSSLYLNIAKCYEDLSQFDDAIKHYRLAKEYSALLSDDGYGNLIKRGIEDGIQRVTDAKNE